jgi:hypothetical protein
LFIELKATICIIRLLSAAVITQLRRWKLGWRVVFAATSISILLYIDNGCLFANFCDNRAIVM